MGDRGPRPSWMPQQGTTARSSPRAAFNSASARAAQRWFVDNDGVAEPSAELLSKLRKLSDENLRSAYGEAAALVRNELARLRETSKSTTNAITEDGKPASPALLPEPYYHAVAICIGSLDKLTQMRARSVKANDDLFANVSDEELNKNLAHAMAQLLDEMPIEDIEQLLNRRRNFVAAEEGAPRWKRDEDEKPVLELPAAIDVTSEDA